MKFRTSPNNIIDKTNFKRQLYKFDKKVQNPMIYGL